MDDLFTNDDKGDDAITMYGEEETGAGGKAEEGKEGCFYSAGLSDR